MKKTVLALVILCGIWAGSQITRMNCASALSGMPLGVVAPLTNQMFPLTNLFGSPFTNQFTLPLTNQLGFLVTNQIGFTNTLVPAIDLSNAQVGELSILLLSLQTNVELTLPVLTTISSNATLVNLSTNGAFNGTNTTQQAGVALTLGTNTFVVDQQTFRALLALRNDLEQALPVLQQLNGTTPSPINGVGGTQSGGNPIPAITNFATGHLTNNFSTPLTNQPQILTAPSPF